MAAVGDAFDFVKIVQAATTYGDAHRGLLKILIDRGSLSERAFCAHFVRCYATQHFLDEIDYEENQLSLKNVNEATVAELRKQLMTVISTKLQHLGMRLMNARDENKDRKMIVLVSERHYSPALAAASPFDKNELFLVVSWLEAMLKPDSDGYIAMNDALKSARDLPVPMKMEKAQLLIDELFRSDWIRQEAGDNITLTTRALTELAPILRSRYHCATCALCTGVTIRKAAMLACDQCDALIHISCWNSFAGSPSKDSVRCPGTNCKNQLKKADMAEAIKQIREARANPAAAAATQRARVATQKARAAESDTSMTEKQQSKKGRKTARRLVNSDSEPQEEEKEEEDPSSTRRTQRVIEDSDDELLSKTRKRGATQKQPRGRASEEMKEEEEEDDDDVFVDKKQKPTRKTQTRRSATAEKEEEEDDDDVPRSRGKSKSQRVAKKQPRLSSTESLPKQPRKKSKDDEEEDEEEEEL
ncbi:hypothetical protein PFISCL1PPCAC_18445 [Pristionchus fissidentatus]|uniref:Non-structural maintenance of chromosomes element 1 homolog n=1 Tax=Pristionchus fissidentatus TaxID=1538716 RepID=A0AAV5W9R0_9BILA|nr:hypothetical protein PFISCL1PPCAC_18445 [Pristionchus fissidentatus]